MGRGFNPLTWRVEHKSYCHLPLTNRVRILIDPCIETYHYLLIAQTKFILTKVNIVCKTNESKIVLSERKNRDLIGFAVLLFSVFVNFNYYLHNVDVCIIIII